MSIVYRLKSMLRKIQGRKLPTMPVSSSIPSRPMSFVVVRFSDEFGYNIACSACVQNPINQLIDINNTANVFYYSLAEAINAGVKQAIHDLVVVIHEDVYLPKGWQACCEDALTEIEKIHPNWGVIGTAGITTTKVSKGHYSDPNNYCNTFKAGDKYCEVMSVDEHLMLYRQSSNLKMDGLHPGIHGIGTDLVLDAQKKKLPCFVINAPSIHKYRDSKGEFIKNVADSPKIVDRGNYAYKADKKCCDEYISRKWAKITPFSSIVTDYQVWLDPAEELQKIPDEIIKQIDNPLILLAKGGGGSRILSFLVQDCNVCIGNDVNISGDCMDMVIAVYQGVIEKYKCKAPWQKNVIVAQLRLAAAKMLRDMPADKRTNWGFKLPENLLLLDEFEKAFPNARYIQMIRNPIKTCLRRTHMTARLDNQIGRVTLPLAYREAGLPVEQILKDSGAMHMAYTTMHQMSLSRAFCQKLAIDKYFALRFEDIITKPQESQANFSKWVGLSISGNSLVSQVDQKRASNPALTYSKEEEVKVTNYLKDLNQELGY